MPGPAAVHTEQMTGDDVPRRHELEPAADVGAEPAVDEIAQGAAETRGQEVVPADDRATGRHHHVEPLDDRFQAFVLDQDLGALIGHEAFEGIDLQGLVAGRRRVIEPVAHGAERAGDHHAHHAGLAGGAQEVVRPEDVALVDLAPVRGVAVDRRDLRRAVIDTRASRHRRAGSGEIAQIAIDPLDLETLQRGLAAPFAHQDA